MPSNNLVAPTALAAVAGASPTRPMSVTRTEASTLPGIPITSGARKTPRPTSVSATLDNVSARTNANTPTATRSAPMPTNSQGALERGRNPVGI